MRSTFQLLKNVKCKMFSVSWSWPWSCLCPCPCSSPCPYLNFNFAQMPLLHKLSVDALKQQSLITAHTINTATGSITENGTSKMYILYATNANIVQILRRLSFGLRFKGIANDAYQKCKVLLRIFCFVKERDSYISDLCSSTQSNNLIGLKINSKKQK